MAFFIWKISSIRTYLVILKKSTLQIEKMIKFYLKRWSLPLSCLMLTGFLYNNLLFAQETSELNNLSKFKPNSGTWHEAGWAMADINLPNVIKFEKGEGLLVNQPTKKNNGQDLVSIEEFADIDLELEIMVAPKSNSGVYLMGQYEVQILDSWGKPTARAGDMGGIYERWDDSKPDGEKGYQGYAPRQNVSRAPGIWQHLKVSFQAPRFDESGQKTENAKFLSVYLNGVLIHENLEVFGPTRGSLNPNDIPKGPVRIQGDHGAVAFRNIKVTKYDSPEPLISNLKYEVYMGTFFQEPEYSAMTAESKGQVNNLQEPVQTPAGPNLIRYSGDFILSQSGEYTIHMLVSSGTGLLKINGKNLTKMGEEYQGTKVTLEKGTHPIEILVSKTNDWSDPGLDLVIEGQALRGQVILSKNITRPIDYGNPILVDEKQNPVLRSFIDLPDGKRLTHAISVSSPQKVHYSYDLSKGNLVQVWRGNFLEATPMWNNRGNGVSVPLGAVVFLGNPENNLFETEFQSSSKFKAQGYQIKNGGVEFHYENLGLKFKDFISDRDDGKGLDRFLTAEGSTAHKRYSIATGTDIRKVKEGLFWIVDQGYYIQIDPKSPSSPVIESGSDGQQLMVSINQPLRYSLLF